MVDPELWREVSPYLDHALSLRDEERTAWVRSVHERNPKLGSFLESLLGEHRILEQGTFLTSSERILPDHLNLDQPSLDQPNLAGRTIGAYTLLSPIGRGGMANVWLAERSDGRFKRYVAIKFLNIALLGQSGEHRFRSEGNILAKLTHPNIAELIDADVSPDGRPCLIIEYVKGQHIDDYCAEKKLDVQARIQLFLDVLAAVAHAHRNLIVHRDIKPSNVLVRSDGQVKLLDFGIAKLLSDEEDAGKNIALTADGVHPMTPQYAAPEQLTGGPITTGTDIYSLGVLLYVLLTSQHPAGSCQTYAELVKAVVEIDPILPSTAIAKDNKAASTAAASRILRGDLDNITIKALKKNPCERYASVDAFAEDLRRYLRNEPVSARPDTTAYRTAKFIRRNRLSVALALFGLIATLTGIVSTLIQAHTARVQRDFALRQVERAQVLDEFHEFLLSDAAPSGKPFTVKELLAKGEHIVARQRVMSADRVDLMVSIGNQYWLQDEVDNARRIFEDAYRLSRKLSDQSIRARASCILASSISEEEQTAARAETLFQEGLHELPEDPRFTLDRIFCLQSGLEVVMRRGEAKEAIARGLAAQQLLRNSPFDSDPNELDRWIDLAFAYTAAGQDLDALSAFERAGGLLSLLGRDETGTAVTVFNNWAVELDQIGRPLEAERMYQRVLSLSRSDPAKGELSPDLMLNYARTLRKLNRVDEAQDYAQRSYSKATQINQPSIVNSSLLELAQVYVAKNDLPQAAGVLAKAEEGLRRSLPADHYAFGSVAALRASIALAKGEADESLLFANQAVAITEASVKRGKQGLFALPNLLIGRSRIELRAGLFDQSASDARKSLGLLLENRPGIPSCYLGQSYLALGLALQAQDKRTDAHSAFLSATENLRHTLGDAHPDTRRAQQLAKNSL